MKANYIMNTKKVIFGLFTLCVLVLGVALFAHPTYASNAETESTTEAEEEAGTSDVGSKAMASGIVVGLAACGGAIAMGITSAKANEAIARQPEAEGKIRGAMMLGLVFIETAIIYALIVAILIIFVM